MKDSFKRIIIKGTLILTISNILVSGLNYISNSLSAKSLGPAGFGELSALFAYLSIFYTPLTVLTTLIIVKLGKSQKNRLETAQEIEQWFRYKLFEKRYYVLIGLASVLIIPYVTNLSPASSLLLYCLVFLGVISTFYFALLQGLHLFTHFALLLVIVAMARLAGTITAYMNYGGIYSIYFGLIIGGIISLILSTRFIPHTSFLHSPMHNIKLRDYIMRKQTVITAISLLAIALLMNVDLMFVKKSFSAELAGIYSSWSLLARIIGYFTAPMLAVSLLFFSAKESERDHKKILYFLLLAVVIIGSCVLLLYERYTTEVLLIIFSSQFLGIAPLAPYAALFGMLITIIALINNYHISNSNKSALITPLIMPIHICLLILFGISLENIIAINVGSAFFIAGILTISLLHST